MPYPAPPGYRFAYDQDGSALIHLRNDGAILQATNPQSRSVNDESITGNWALDNNTSFFSRTVSFGVLFPQRRSLAGYFLSLQEGTVYELDPASMTVEVSGDSTNLQDGIWTALGGWVFRRGVVHPYDRSAISALTANDVVAVRFTYESLYNIDVDVLHLYGSILAGQDDDRLAIWHPTQDTEVTPTYFDFGDIQQGSSSTTQFRVKNLSADLTAGGVVVATELLTDGVPSLAGHLTLSAGGAFSPTINIGSLAPSATSAVLTLQRLTALDSPLGIWSPRLTATPTTMA